MADGSGDGGRDEPPAFDEDFVRAAAFQEPSARARQNVARFARQEGDERDQARARRRARARARRWWTAGVCIVAAAFLFAVVRIDPTGRSTPEGGDAAGTVDSGAHLFGAVGTTARPTPMPAASNKPLGRPPHLEATDRHFKFIAVQGDSESPVAYDPCRPVEFVVNDADAPPGGAAIIEDAVATISRATGLRFDPAGMVDETPSAGRAAFQPGRYPGRWAPVLIAWTRPGVVDALAGDVAGIGGSNRVSVDGQQVYVSGLIALDGPQIGSILRRDDGQEVARAIVMHELGHLVGLDHVDDPHQLMFERGQAGIDEPQAGDRTGLAALGKGQCFRFL